MPYEPKTQDELHITPEQRGQQVTLYEVAMRLPTGPFYFYGDPVGYDEPDAEDAHRVHH